MNTLTATTGAPSKPSIVIVPSPVVIMVAPHGSAGVVVSISVPAQEQPSAPITSLLVASLLSLQAEPGVPGNAGLFGAQSSASQIPSLSISEQAVKQSAVATGWLSPVKRSEPITLTHLK